MQTSTPSSLFIRDPDLISTDMDGDTVMLSIERGEYFGIGGVGTRVWELLEQAVSMQTIVQAICAEYDVDEATCLADVQAFFNELLKDRMIKPA
nr:lasso peptide biosynthesis PqqD family chaperone [uncultured Rhodoferax sp.]